MPSRAATIWRVRLFDGPMLERADGAMTTRFRSAKVQGLLAFLALRLGRRCPRETIADALWPDEIDPAVTANRLRVTLASLRRQLEPPGTPFGAVLDVSVPGSVVLREATVWCDVAEFDRALAAGRTDEAAALRRGPLLPGLTDEWVRDEQLRFEVLADDLPPAPPASTAPAEVAPSYPLPLYLTRFVGRESERRALLARLQESRLVTLTGPPGIGKTRLAVETAEAAALPAVFVSLDAAPFAEAAVGALGLASRTLESPMAQLVAAFRERPPTLLILDDADGQIDAVAEGVLRLLAEVPGLRALVTSRQRLEIPGETVVAVPPLPIPSDEGDLQSSPSAALFLDRARNAVPDFVLRERHAAAVGAICRRLEGMPLALELAAARVAVQSLAQIAASVEANLMELRSRQRGLSERHRSLRAAIQTAYEALPPELRRLFVRLAAFRGGWTAEAARVVADEPRAEALLEELQVRSLVYVREEGDDLRYAYLEPLRAFAEESLSTGEAEDARKRHAAYYLGLAARVTENDVRTLAPLDAETENLRVAMEAKTDWAGLAGALVHAFVRGHHRQALRWIEASAPRVGAAEDPALRFRWRYAACLILPDVGRLDETEAIAGAMREEAERTGDAQGGIYADVIHAYVEEFRGNVVQTLKVGGDALARARELGDRHLLETCLSHRSGTLHVYGSVVGPETEAGHEALVEAEALARELCGLVPPHSRRLPLGPLLVGAALWPQGRLREAYDAFKEAQTAALRVGTTNEPMYAFVSEAVISEAWGHFEHAAVAYGAFAMLQERMGYSLERAQSSRGGWIEELAARLRARLGEPAFDGLVARGRTTPLAVLAARRVVPPER